MILAFLGLMAWIFPVSSSMGAEGPEADQHNWIGAMRSAVLAAQAWENDLDGATYAPYLGQLYVIQAAALRGDEAATYAAMNRFMDMLESREGGIPTQAANELFNCCNLVTPAPLHDVGCHAGPPRIAQPRLPAGAR
jgi:hypothetical protein